MATVPGIAFLSIANAARSQIAEGFARALLGSRAIVSSAGIRPLHVDPHTITVMREHGIELRTSRAKPIEAIDLATLELVVVVGDDDIRPSRLAHVARVQWPIASPASNDPSISHVEMLARFRRARDAIRRHVVELAATLRDRSPIQRPAASVAAR